MLTRVLVVCCASALLACHPPGVALTVRPLPGLSRGVAQGLMLRADDIRQRAFEFPGTVTLSESFGGSALKKLEAQSESFGRRGVRIEQRNQKRDVVYWDAVSNEGIMQIAADSRLAIADQPTRSWTGTLSQWWVRLDKIGGTWLVVDEEELAPDRWRPFMPDLSAVQALPRF